MRKEIQLRDYQLAGIQDARDRIKNGARSVMFYLSTGGGKSLCIAHLLMSSYEKGAAAYVIVDRRVLVEQISATLDEYGIPHGVAMSGHWRYRPSERIQVASTQTLEARGFFPGAKLLLIDEAHIQRESVKKLMESRKDLIVVGFSATPTTPGLSKSFDCVVSVVTTNQLISDGWLVMPTFYAAKSPDMTGAKLVAGEYSDKEVTQRGLKIIGDVVQEWVDKTNQHFGGPVKTICFSSSVDHGAAICEAFQASGYNFQQISDKDTNDERRRALIDEFKKADSSIVGLVSCEALTRGFDVPDILCGIGARPYRKSFSSHIQQIGRVMRPHPGKSEAIWLCHSMNALRFWNDMQSLFANGVTELKEGGADTARKEPTERERKNLTCSACGHILPPRVPACPACGHERPRRNLVETVPGQLVLINGKHVPATGRHAYLAEPNKVWRQLCYIATERKPGDMEAARRWAEANYRKLYGEFAHRRFDNTDPLPPCPELVGKIRSEQIRWARRAG